MQIMQNANNADRVSEILSQRGNEYGDFKNNCSIAISFFKENFESHYMNSLNNVEIVKPKYQVY